MMDFYSDTYDQTVHAFGNDLEKILPKEYAFNSFAKIYGLNKVNHFDFCLNLFLSTGIMHDTGSCFGLRQRDWQNRADLGYWLRITYSRNPKQMVRGVKIFRQFKRQYLRNPSDFYLTGNIY